MRQIALNIAILLALCSCSKQGGDEKRPYAVSNPGGPDISAQGTVNGGGGIGIRCGGRLQTLDLFEAKQSGLTLIAPPDSQVATIDLVSKTFANHFWNIDTIPTDQLATTIAKEILSPIFEGRPFKNAQTNKSESVTFVESLPLSGDLGKYLLPNGCSLEQIAYFSDGNTTLSIVRSAWNELDWLSKGILAAHELIYMMDRRDGLENLRADKSTQTSESTREFVGRLFTVESVPSFTDNIPSVDKIYICRSVRVPDGALTYLYAFNRTGSPKLSFVFNEILGHQSFYQMRVDFDGLTLETLLNTPEGIASEAKSIKLTGFKQNPDFLVEIEKTKGNSPTLLLIDSKGGRRPIKTGQSFKCDKYR